MASRSRASVKYKKAPQAPRRFKSAYMFYSTEKHKSIRKELAEKGENDKISTTEVAKMVSKAWKHLSEEERDVFEEMARKDKARYEMEKSNYKGPWKVPANSRAFKDPSAPKRPMSTFLSFSNAKRSEVLEKYPTAGSNERAKVLALMWKEAPEEEKKQFVDEEYRLRQDYKRAMAKWRKNADEDEQTKRQEREDKSLQAVIEGRPLGFEDDHDAGGYMNASYVYPMHAQVPMYAAQAPPYQQEAAVLSSTTTTETPHHQNSAQAYYPQYQQPCDAHYYGAYYGNYYSNATPPNSYGYDYNYSNVYPEQYPAPPASASTPEPLTYDPHPQEASYGHAPPPYFPSNVHDGDTGSPAPGPALAPYQYNEYWNPT